MEIRLRLSEDNSLCCKHVIVKKKTNSLIFIKVLAKCIFKTLVAPSCRLILQNQMPFQFALNTVDVFIHINMNPDISGITRHFCGTCQAMSREPLYNMQRKKMQCMFVQRFFNCLEFEEEVYYLRAPSVGTDHPCTEKEQIHKQTKTDTQTNKKKLFTGLRASQCLKVIFIRWEKT